MSKICTKCFVEKEDEAFRWYKKCNRLYFWCNECFRIAGEQWRRKNGIKSHSEIKELRQKVNKKVCTRCHIEKNKSEFRVRIEDGQYEYINSTCRLCDTEMAKEYYDKHKHDADFKQKNVIRVRKYANSNCKDIKARRSTVEYKKKHAEWEGNRYHRKKDEINAKQRIKREKAEYKQYVKEYAVKNKDRILELGRQRNNRYIKKIIKENPDKYAIKKLMEQTGLSKDELIKFPQIIEAKKIILNLKRKIKNND